MNTDTPTPQMMRAAIYGLAAARTVPALWAATATEIRRLTGFDRVMVYRFHPDDHGEVVAEDVADDMEPYLGLHYPASDIPAQARTLYLTKLSRAIVDSAGAAVPLSTVADGSGDPLDLSRSELRSVSPHHLEFMRNMGQASTLSFSLIVDGRLVGMITCAHRTVKRIPFELRRDLEILASQVALRAHSMAEVQRLRRHGALPGLRRRLIEQVARSGDVIGALLHGEVTVLDVIRADGVAVMISGRSATLGKTPEPAEIAAMVEQMRHGHSVGMLATAALAQEHPALSRLIPGVAGLILVPLGGEGGYVAWFREEVIRSVDWLGDQTPQNRLTTLSPRTSFSSWSRSVTGTSAPWDELEHEAVELCRDLDGALFRRVEAELKAEQERRYRNQRMESLGTLAGGIAHDLNNVLTPILLTTQLLRSDESDDWRREALESIETSVNRGAELIRQVLTFAKGEDRRITVLDIPALLDQVKDFCRQTLPATITVETDTATDLRPVDGDSTQMLQVLINLATNARDAMPAGGQLIFRATNDVSPDPSRSRDRIILEVEDTGTGMGAETVSRVFEPFFTTKEVGQGTGLGLSTSIAIIHGHGGDIEVSSELGRGTTFRLTLPASTNGAEPAVQESAPTVAPGSDGNHRLVLIVDDDVMIRRVVQDALESNGYRTLIASHGVDAVAVIEGGGEPPALVFSDMMMPVMGGAAIAAYLHENHPEIPLVLASGMSPEVDINKATSSGVRHFLPKPYAIDELLRTIALALDERRGAPPTAG